jgi:C4-dicarboxylate transporter DctM subunit
LTDPLVIGTLGMAGMFLLIALHVPIGAAMAIAGFLAFAAIAGFGPAVTLFGTETASAMGNLDLLAIPLFLLMGGFAATAGLSTDVYRLAHAFIGHKRGGLAVSTIFGCAGFGAVCGSSVATASAMTTVALPEMRARGYQPALSTGCIAAGGTLGILIPPSIIMVLYALLTEQFVITLYVAALVPSVIAVVLQVAAVAWVVHRNPLAAPAGERTSWRARVGAVYGSWIVIALTLLIFVGIYAGIFTVNEAAAVGAAVTFIVTVTRGRLTKELLIRTLSETASTTGMIYLVLIGANVLTYFVTASGMPEAMVGTIKDSGLPPLLVIGVLLVIYIILGAIFEEVSVMLITLPFVLPMIVGFGYSPVWWGIINVIVIEIGMICPPIGLNVFVVHGLAKDVPLKTIYQGIMPFLYADIARLALLVAAPGLIMWLPNLAGLK